ncbi:hypothetical protein REISMN_08520 (plasmid) [Rickettsia tamurae subsp. buchneri]|uniref:Uncharacterized protein n=1 Tax=Rickettsia tamurae subsp. buchneri TaxID=1462938 RepID=A0A8E0WKI4_9RICK|nr:hypothetical protein REIS_2162 [Rickettsia endosymbiont of Ixodes scapularis]KDO02161.1 hypothetical protein REISMN_08520 [Rickettsia tamurae subsp. buchneri]
MYNIKYCFKNICLIWWHFIPDKKKIIPALTVSTCIVLYPVILKLQNYNWDAIFAYIQCCFLNIESTIELWDTKGKVIPVRCVDILNNTEYIKAIYSGIILLILTLLAICIMPMIVLTTVFLIHMIISVLTI